LDAQDAEPWQGHPRIVLPHKLQAADKLVVLLHLDILVKKSALKLKKQENQRQMTQ
jgi:hypothetical protein